MMRTILLLGCLLAALTCGAVLHAQEPPALRPWPANPWYWSLNGQPVLLLGGSDDDNLFQWSEQKLVAQLDRLAAAGGNYIRNTMSDRRIEGFEIHAYARRPDGRYDLNRWNDEYWQRFERLLRETARRNIVVQIEVWDRFDYTDHTSEKHWQAHPYNPANNVNYTAAQSGLATRYADHPGLNRQPFFFTTPNQRHNRTLLAVQQRFVDKLLDHSLGYDHVLYCMDNETNGEEAWSRYWAEYIKEQARRRGRQVQVTEMWGDWRLTGAEHRRTFDHPELFDFVEVSQNTHKSGQRQWDDLAAARAYLGGQPRPMNTVKVYGAKDSAFGQDGPEGHRTVLDPAVRRQCGGPLPPAGCRSGTRRHGGCLAARGPQAERAGAPVVRAAGERFACRARGQRGLPGRGRPGQLWTLFPGGRVGAARSERRAGPADGPLDRYQKRRKGRATGDQRRAGGGDHRTRAGQLGGSDCPAAVNGPG